MITPRIVPVVSVTGLLGLLLIFGLTAVVMHSNDAETERDCERSIAARDDSRAMWLYLLKQAETDKQTAEQRARTVAFVRELNDRLPPLKCDDGNPVPDQSKP